MNENINCKWCKRNFTSLSVLNRHQKTTKYCLKLQGITKNKNEVFLCNLCNHDFTTSSNLRSHKRKYHSKYKFLLKQKNYEIANQRDKYEKQIDEKQKEFQEKLNKKQKKCTTEINKLKTELIQIKEQLANKKGHKLV